jgi:MOSC domain-containing protein YiiM
MLGIKNYNPIISIGYTENKFSHGIDHGVNFLQNENAMKRGVGMAKVLAVCISQRKGEQKRPVDEIECKIDHGIVGDAHAGNWHRQISLLAQESVKKVQEKIDFPLKPGDFAENILTEGISLCTLPVGTTLKIGGIRAEVTQIGKECHQSCVIRQKAGDCVMPREGIFVKVLEEGTVRPGDDIVVEK